jgi:hypothetical protein
MRLPKPHYQIAKIKVGGNQNSMLIVRDLEDTLIWQAVRILPTDTGGIVSEHAKMRNETGIRALVEQEPHAEARVASVDVSRSDRSR